MEGERGEKRKKLYLGLTDAAFEDEDLPFSSACKDLISVIPER